MKKERVNISRREFLIRSTTVGAGFTLVGSLGLVRLRDFYSRLHGPTKATTLGVGSLLIALAVQMLLEGVSSYLGQFLQAG